MTVQELIDELNKVEDKLLVLVAVRLSIPKKPTST